MDPDFSIELGREDAVLDFPWTDPAGKVAYVDLKRRPELMACTLYVSATATTVPARVRIGGGKADGERDHAVVGGRGGVIGKESPKRLRDVESRA